MWHELAGELRVERQIFVQTAGERRGGLCGAGINGRRRSKRETGRNPTVPRLSESAKRAASAEIAGKAVFQKSDATAAMPVGATILDVTAVPRGNLRILSPEARIWRVRMEVENAPTDSGKAEDYILARQARIRSASDFSYATLDPKPVKARRTDNTRLIRASSYAST